MTFTHRPFDTQKLLHTDAFTHRHCYTETLLHKPFYTHTHTFTHKNFYTQTLLHTNASTHKRVSQIAIWQCDAIMVYVQAGSFAEAEAALTEAQGDPVAEIQDAPGGGALVFHGGAIPLGP